MAGISFRICGICLLLSSLAVVQSQAQRGGGRTPAERRSGAPLDPTGPQPQPGQSTASTPAVNPAQPQPSGVNATGAPGAGQPQRPNQPAQFFPGRNSAFTPQPARPQGQPTDAEADADSAPGQLSNPAGAAAQSGPQSGQKTGPVTAPRQTTPAATRTAAIAGTPRVQPAPLKTASANTGGMPMAAGSAFIGPQLPPPPQAPLPPEKQAATPPHISFQNGLLTLECTNSRLSDVLNGIRTRLNIQFEGMDAAPERVAVKLGPAPADEVLASLLQGSRFDYVILGKPEDPHSVERVMLTAKGGSPMTAMAGQPPVKPQPAEEEEGVTEEQTLEQPQNQPPAEIPQQAVQQPVPQPGTSGVQTPEELLEKLNRLKAEQQGQGQGAVQPNTTAAPLKRPLPQ